MALTVDAFWLPIPDQRFAQQLARQHVAKGLRRVLEAVYQCVVRYHMAGLD